jgi:putative methyltransferase (TIGR04325 family)
MSSVTSQTVYAGQGRRASALSRLLFSIAWAPAALKMLDWVERLIPPIRAWHRFAYQNHFARITTFSRTFNGIYQSFEQAQSSIPAAKSQGYNNPASLDTVPVSSSLCPSDYPILFWLRPLLTKKARLFDLGGHVGIAYYSYQQYVQYPQGLEWIICDVPTVTRAGEQIATTRSSAGLRFTNNMSDADGADILLAAGSLMFVEESLAHALRGFKSRPAHILINKVPLYDGPDFVTVQDSGPYACPYRVFDREKFIREIADLGYEVVDAWNVAELSCLIPFHPEKSIPTYSGLYMRRKAPN